MKPSRREFVRKGRDALVVGFALYRGVAPVIAWGQTAQPTASTAKPVAPEELDSWLSIGRDGKVTVYTGRIDMGTGAETAFGQVVADELDVRFESVKVVMGDTELTPDQGKSTASSNASVGARPLRVAAAEARCPRVIESERDKACPGIDDKPNWGSIDSGGHGEVAAPIGAIDERMVGRRPEYYQRLGPITRWRAAGRQCVSRAERALSRGRRPWFRRRRRRAQIPINPAISLPICIFHLAQLAVVGNDHTGPVFFIDDLLAGDAFRQCLRRGERRHAGEDQSTERQRRFVHNSAPRPRTLARAFHHDTMRGPGMLSSWGFLDDL